MAEEIRGGPGGKRDGGGRPGGSGNRDTFAVKKQMMAMSRKLGVFDADDEEAGLKEFDGDALDFLRVVYRDPRVPLDVRIDAAKTAVRFERPALQAVEVGGKGGGAISVVMLPSDADV